MTDKPANTDEYLATLTVEQRAALAELRDAILAVAPEAEAGFSYGMPLLRLGGKPLLWYAAWRRHYSLYPVGPAMLERLAIDPAEYETSKGTIRFPASRPLPHALVTRLAQARVAELREKGR
jgi:uncharacterized protein YdhG (YjbR/CyaY superfamily)